MNKVIKQPAETLVGVGIDFGTRLSAGAAIEAHSVTCDPAGIVVVSVVSGTRVLATLAGGEKGKDYRINYKVTGSDGSIRVANVTLEVREF